MQQLPDSNVWLALALAQHQFHPTAVNWLGRQTQPDSVAFCRATQQSFLRLLTTEAIFAPYGTSAMNNAVASAMYDGFRADKRITWIDEPTGLESIWKKFASSKRSSPKLWMDAYLAAFAVTERFQIVTTDKAFRQFRGLNLLILGS